MNLRSNTFHTMYKIKMLFSKNNSKNSFIRVKNLHMGKVY